VIRPSAADDRLISKFIDSTIVSINVDM